MDLVIKCRLKCICAPIKPILYLKKDSDPAISIRNIYQILSFNFRLKYHFTLATTVNNTINFFFLKRITSS